MAHKDCSPDTAKATGDPDGARAGGTAAQAESVRTDSSTLMRLTIDELLILAPRLRTYLSTPRPVWRDIVDAADWLRAMRSSSAWPPRPKPSGPR